MLVSNAWSYSGVAGGEAILAAVVEHKGGTCDDTNARTTHTRHEQIQEHSQNAGNNKTTPETRCEVLLNCYSHNLSVTSDVLYQLRRYTDDRRLNAAYNVYG